VVLIQVEVVTSENVAVDSCVDAVEIDAVLARLSMRDYLLVPGDMGRNKLHGVGGLQVRKLRNMGRVGVAESGDLAVEKSLERCLGPGQVRVFVGVHINPSPVVRSCVHIHTQVVEGLLESPSQVVSTALVTNVHTFADDVELRVLLVVGDIEKHTGGEIHEVIIVDHLESLGLIRAELVHQGAVKEQHSV